MTLKRIASGFTQGHRKLAGSGCVAVLVLLLMPALSWAQCGVYKTWTQNEILTSQDMNLAFQRTVDANTPICSKGYSASVSQMQVSTNPYPGGAESRATTMAGELERLRFQLKAIVGKGQWYHTVDNSLASGVPKNIGTSYTKYKEIPDPAPPGVDELNLYAKDDGAGKTVLAYVDHNGVVNTLFGPSSSYGASITIGLDIRNNPGATNTKLDVKADRISVAGFIKTNLSVTIDASGTGANALDVGSLVANTFYYVWLIYRPTDNAFAALVSSSGTAPALPTGYTGKRLIGGASTNPSGVFRVGTQIGNTYSYTDIANSCKALVGTVSSQQVNDFAPCLPNTGGKTGGFLFAYPNTAGAGSRSSKMHWQSFSGGITSAAAPVAFFSTAASSWAGEVPIGSAWMPLFNTSNRSIVFVDNTFDQVAIYVTGWSMEFLDGS